MIYKRSICRVSYRFCNVALYSLGFLFLLGTLCLAEEVKQDKKEDKPVGYSVKQIDGVWWFIDSAGKPFYCIAVTNCQGPRWEWSEPPADAPDGPEYKAYAEKFEADCKVFHEYFKKWNFNTAGAWSGNFNGRVPRTITFTGLWRARFEKVPTHSKYNFPDVYDPKFKEVVERWAGRIVKPNADDPLLIGWFLDNEFYLPQDEAFQEQFYKVLVGAIRKYDKKSLLLGTRHESPNRSDLDLRMEAKYCDVLSVNAYGLCPSIKKLQRYYKITGKPIMLTEFTFAAKDSGLTNSRSMPGLIVETQADRAKGYEIYTSTMASLPYVVGTHFFIMIDRPNEGGAGTQNWGLIDSDKIPYYEFVSRLPAINAKLPGIHAGKIKPKRYPEDYPGLTFPYNDNPHTKNAVGRDKDKNWVCQRSMYHYACTAGTGPYCFFRNLDESWGTKEYGFIEYRFDIEKDFDKPFLILRYSRYPGRPTHVLQLQINNQEPISVSLPASIGEPTVPSGWDYGFANQKLNTIAIPLKKPIPKGLVNVRFCVTKPWENGKGVQLHSFFLTDGPHKVDKENFYQVVPLDSPEKEKTNNAPQINSPFRDLGTFLDDAEELNIQY